jgi:cell wall-associated NlpC family hydrolase
VIENIRETMSANRPGMIRQLKWLPLAAGLLLGGCLSMPSGDDGRTASRQAPVSEQRLAVVSAASRMIGTPYRYGGNTPRGFDCSGLVQYAHDHAGLDVPRTTVEQWRHADSLRRRHLLPGDLLFFSIGRDKARHVAIYEGGGVFIHAPSAGKRVSRASLDNPYWSRRMLGARSFL